MPPSRKHKTTKAKTAASAPDAISGLEDTIHKYIADYLRLVIKAPSVWHTVEVSNNQKGFWAMLNQKNRTRKGVRTGWPDIELGWRSPQFENTKLVFMEVKIPGVDAEPHQKVLHDELRGYGHLVYVVHSVSEVEAILKQLGVI